MSKIIIGVHGMGNKPSKKTLQAWWKAPIREGFRKIDKPKLFFNFELFYWAHYLNPTPLQPRTKDEKHPLFIEEPYYPSKRETVSEKKPSRIRLKILDYLNRQLDKFFLKEDFTINHESVAEFLIHHFSRDLETYYSDHCIVHGKTDCRAKHVICTALAKVLKKHRRKKILLIAHSMGAIIAYDVLTQFAADVSIDTLVTIGAPLGLPVIKSRFITELKEKDAPEMGLKTPENVVSNWYNLSDLKDKIAINYDLGDDFGKNSKGIHPIDLIVTNDYEFGGRKNPHKSYGYLRTPEMADIIKDFLGEYRYNPFYWFRRFTRSL